MRIRLDMGIVRSPHFDEKIWPRTEPDTQPKIYQQEYSLIHDLNQARQNYIDIIAQFYTEINMLRKKQEVEDNLYPNIPLTKCKEIYNIVLQGMKYISGKNEF